MIFGFIQSSFSVRNFNSLLFQLDQNGSLTANQIFDYETDDLNYTISVRAFDDHNATFDKTLP